MRTLGEILDLAKRGGDPTREELHYGLVALESLATFDAMDLRKLAAAGGVPAKLYYSEHFRRNKTALATSPKEWLGPDSDPMDPAVQERSRRAVALLERLSGSTAPHEA